MLERMADIFRQWRDARSIRQRLGRLKASVELATQYLSEIMPKPVSDPRISRVLISGGRQLFVQGTDEQIEAAAMGLRRRTRQCVSVAVVTGHYHAADCDSRPRRGGFDPAGN